MTRSRLAVLAIATFALATPAAALDGVNLHHGYRPLDGRGFHHVDEASTIGQWRVHGGAAFSLTYRPLELGRQGDNRVRPAVNHLGIVDVFASLGLVDDVKLGDTVVLRHLSFGMVLPLVFDNDGERLPDLARDTRQYGLGAARFQLKATLIEDREGFSLGVKPFLTIPSGRERDYTSDDGYPTGGAMLLATHVIGRVRLGIEAGYEVTSHLRFADLKLKDRLRYGAGVDVAVLRDLEGGSLGADPIKHDLSLGGEVFGWLNGRQPFHDEREQPVEALGFFRYRLVSGSFEALLSGGAGAGLNNGIGAPDTRLVLQLGVTFF